MRKFLVVTAVAVMVALAAPAFAATNPFMDVPLNHWAYDAIGQLAANGILSGYPDGTYKGKQPTTRYEMASALARALAVVDMTKASKQDVEMMKKLIIEFRDELDALGVKVDQLDKRVSTIESRLGGWKISGMLRLDLYNGDYGTDTTDSVGGASMARGRLFLERWFGEDEDIHLLVRIGSQHPYTTDTTVTGAFGAMSYERFYVEIPVWDGRLTVGRFNKDLEAGYYFPESITGNVGYGFDALMTDRGVQGIAYEKSFGLGKFTGYVAHPNSSWGSVVDDDNDINTPDVNIGTYGAWELVVAGQFQFTEQFGFDIGVQYFAGDDSSRIGGNFNKFGDRIARATADTRYVGVEFDSLLSVWGGLRFDFNENVALKGQYIYQDLGDISYADGANAAGATWTTYQVDNTKAYKLLVDVKQDLLKFTSLWLEYDHYDAGFIATNGSILLTQVYDTQSLSANYALPTVFREDTKVWRIGAGQKWNDKWSTFVYASNYKFDEVDGSLLQWALGFVYAYNPNVKFSLAYSALKADDEIVGHYTDDRSILRFRTQIAF
ncbi:S-layer protein [Synergistales bacterium]|nr:S-layer protein [Synergistales bacterium]